MLCCGQHVARELRIERARSNICEFYAKQLEKKLQRGMIFNIFIISGNTIFDV